jgi:small subunit ribosomal protein S16
MLVIRLQRTGRSGHAQFRVVVQDVRQTPTSGQIVAALGTYDPHTKKANIDVEKVKFYLSNGAQPSGRLTAILKELGVKLPNWVELPTKKQRAIRHGDKLRKNRPAEVKEAKPAPTETEEPAEEAAEPVEEVEPEATVAEVASEPVAETATEPVVEAEVPAETPKEVK